MKTFILLSLLLLTGCNQEPVWARELTASWYDIDSLIKEGTWKKSKGRMANGEYFNEYAFTCANRLYHMGSMLRITDIKSGKSVIVRTTDRIGKRFARTRIDLSKGAMEALGGKPALKQGLLQVKVEILR